MIHLHKGSVIDYSPAKLKSVENIPPISLEDGAYQIRVSASHSNRLTEGKSVTLTTHIFSSLTGEELELDIPIRWERKILGIEDRQGISDSKYNSNPPIGKSLKVSYQDIFINGEFTAIVLEKDIDEAFEEENPLLFKIPSILNKKFTGSYIIWDDTMLSRFDEDWEYVFSNIENTHKMLDSIKQELPSSIAQYVQKHKEELKGKDGSKIAGILSRENKEPSYWNKWGEVGVVANWSGLAELQPKVGDLIYIVGTDSEGNARQIVAKYREDKQAETIAHTLTKKGKDGKDGKSIDFLDLYAKKIKGGAISRDPRPAIDVPWNDGWMSNEYGNINYHDTGIKLTSKGLNPHKDNDTWEGRPSNVGVWIDNARWDKEAVGKTYYTKIIAKIPKGVTIEYVNRNYGGECKWLTPTIGTDEYETYIYKVEYKAKANNGSFYFSTLDQQARKFDVYIKQIDLYEEDLTKRLEQSVSNNLEQLLGQSDKFQQGVTNSLYKKGIASKVADKLGQNASFRETLEQEIMSSEDLQNKIKAQSSKTLKEITLDPNFLNTLKFTVRTCTPVGTVIQDPELIDFLKGEDSGISNLDSLENQLHIGGIPQTCQSYSKTLPELLYEQQMEIQQLKSGHREKVVNLVHHPKSTYDVKEDDFYIVARSTGNGDRNPLIRFSDAKLPTFGVWKVYHFDHAPSIEIQGDVNVYGIVDTAGFDLEKGYEYTLRKTWGSWWQVTRVKIS